MNVADELFKIWSAKPAHKSSAKTDVKKSERKTRGSRSETKPVKPKSGEEPKKHLTLLEQFLDSEKSLKINSSSSVSAKAEEPNSPNFMKAIRSIQKNAEKLGIPKESGTFCKNGTLYILDGHRVVKSKYDFLGVKDNPDGMEVERFFESSQFSKKINSPSFNELSKLVKETRKNAGKRKPTRVLYQFDNGLTVNADYLLDAMAITGNTEFGYSDNGNPLCSRSEDGLYEVVVCPVNSVEKFRGCKIA